MRNTLWILGALIIGFVVGTRAHAAMVMPLYVEELTARAEKLFVGTCTKVEDGVNAQGLPFVEVTFTVAEGFKGPVAETVTFRQLDPTAQPTRALAPWKDGLVRESSPWSAAIAAGMPSYVPGEQAVLFLASPGSLGLTAPIGLSQGKLPVTTTANGDKLVTNMALTKTTLTSATLPDPGKTGGYAEFVRAMRTIAQAAQQ
jgi:hypothetical protein